MLSTENRSTSSELIRALGLSIGILILACGCSTSTTSARDKHGPKPEDVAREYAIATLSMDAAGVCDVAAKELRKGRNCGDSPSGPPAEANDYVFEATPGDVEVGPQKALVEISYKFHYVGSDPSQAQDNGLQLTNTGHGQVTLTRENGEWRVASDTLEDNQG